MNETKTIMENEEFGTWVTRVKLSDGSFVFNAGLYDGEVNCRSEASAIAFFQGLNQLIEEAI